MSEKTAIELIYEMHTMLANMEARLDMMEKNILLINDKANGKMFEAVTRDMPKGHPGTPQEMAPPPPSRKAPGATTIGPERLQPSTPAEPQPARQQNVRVFGKFLDIRKKPISDIEVTVLDANNSVVKQTKTNRAGEWTSFLPPGQYSVEFIKENMAPQFRAFDVKQGQREIEVM